VSPATTSLDVVSLQTSFERPAPVRVIAQALTGYVDKLGPIWVEGQITQLTRRPQTPKVFLTLRDPVAEVSVQVTCHRSVFDAIPVPVTEGARVVVFAKFQYYVPRGSLNLEAREIRPVGVGELLARIEQRRQLLAAEGLFDAARKRPLPFLPAHVGLIVGRDSAAERDVLESSRRRWPGVRFRVEHTAVQGHDAARQVIEALAVLDKEGSVDVIVIARGGGAVEDLLPFSDEGLLRAVAATSTPVVSAIGHEQDSPLLDLVADVRASTPTDAAKRIVPDMHDEAAKIQAVRNRARSVLHQHLQREQQGLTALRSRPVLASPLRALETQTAVVVELRERARRCLDSRLTRASDETGHQLARVRTLSPLATLQRGYAVLQSDGGDVITAASQVSKGDPVVARLAAGRVRATVSSTSADDDRQTSAQGIPAGVPTSEGQP
jgi:exodeoxyribonuclease VII large subunit